MACGNDLRPYTACLCVGTLKTIQDNDAVRKKGGSLHHCNAKKLTLVKFFQGEGLGLGHEQQNNEPANHAIGRPISTFIDAGFNTTHFHAAYHPNAPCGVNALNKRGKVSATTKLKSLRKISAMCQLHSYAWTLTKWLR